MPRDLLGALVRRRQERQPRRAAAIEHDPQAERVEPGGHDDNRGQADRQPFRDSLEHAPAF
jgi:hypothetical protein